jgi:hypothetical protein
MMTLSDAKKLFRKSFPIKAGGPADKARAAGAIASLDAVAEAAYGTDKPVTAASITDATDAGRAMLTAADADAQLELVDRFKVESNGIYPDFMRAYGIGGALLWLLEQVTFLLQQLSPSQPDAPTNGHVDDVGNTLDGDLVPGFPAVADYEVFGVPGFPGIVNLTFTGGDVQNGRIYSRGLTGPIDFEGTGIRVAASGNRPAGKWLLNNKAFTGPTPSPKGYQKLYTDKYPAAA